MNKPEYIYTLDIIILLGCFWVLANKNNEMVNILYISLGGHGCAFQGYILMSETVGHGVGNDTFFKCSTTLHSQHWGEPPGDYQQVAAISILALLMGASWTCYFPD